MRRRVTPLVAINLAIVYLGWGSTYLAIRLMVKTIPPLLGAGLRFLVAGVIVLAAVRLRSGAQAVRADRRALAAAALVGVLLPAGGNGIVSLAERTVPSSLAALIIALVPVWMVIATALLGERPTAAGAAGVLLGFCGVGILLLPGGGPAHASTLGMVAIVVASLSWAIGSVASGRMPMPANAFAATGYEMVAGGLAMVIAGAALGEVGRVHLERFSASSVWALVYLVFAGSIVTYSAYVWLLRSAPLPLVSTYAFVNPLVAVALGTLFLSEHVTPAIAAGAALIVAAVALISIRAPGPSRAAVAQSAAVEAATARRAA